MKKGVEMALVGDQGEGQYLGTKALHIVANEKKYEFIKYINWLVTKEKANHNNSSNTTQS